MKYLILLLSFILCLSCSKQEVNIEEISFEFEGNNSAPNLVSNEGELTLSWISSKRDKEAGLNYTQLKNSEWKPFKKIVSGTDWFVNWADYPANATSNDLILTSYLKKSDSATYSYDILLNLQKITGESVRENFLLNTDGVNAEHGFVSMISNKKGGFFIAWLDGRNTVGNEMHGEQHHVSMTIRTAEISKEGVIFNEQELDSRVCDCCQTSIVMTQKGPAVIYRNRSDTEIRDIYITRQINGIWDKPKAIHNDGWKIAGCPVNGPKIVSKENNVAVAWFTAANNSPLVNLSFSKDGGQVFEVPVEISSGMTLGRVDVAFINSKEVLISYMENEDDNTFIKCRKVAIDGTISEPLIIANVNASRSTGVPQLEIFNKKAYVVWTISENGKKQLKSVSFNFEAM